MSSPMMTRMFGVGCWRQRARYPQHHGGGEPREQSRADALADAHGRFPRPIGLLRTTRQAEACCLGLAALAGSPHGVARQRSCHVRLARLVAGVASIGGFDLLQDLA